MNKEERVAGIHWNEAEVELANIDQRSVESIDNLFTSSGCIGECCVGQWIIWKANDAKVWTGIITGIHQKEKNL